MNILSARGRASLLVTGFFCMAVATPQLLAQKNRLSGPIRSSRRVPLAGHIKPQVEAATDEGTLNANQELTDLTLVLRPSADQQAALDQLLKDQQDPSSPNYHRWITPDEYASRFGASSDDVTKITDWLKSQGLQVTDVARARNSVRFQGTAGMVGAALQTQFHRFTLNGRQHFANVTEPSVPADLEFLVSAIHGLDDFHVTPRSVSREAVANFTSSSGRHYLSPDDLAVIYNVKPLYSAGLDGTGQTIVIAGQTQMDMSDVNAFRAAYGLSAVTPKAMLVPGSRDPGISTDDQGEANLDLQWSGAVARNATLLYVYAQDVMTAVQYAIDQNLAPVISVSYGLCEQQNSSASMRAYQTWAQQANAQGITWINAAGDAGGADCAGGTSNAGGFAVDTPASVPEVTGIGGTTLTEDAGTYWAATNGANSGSALSYIPETVWNDSTAGDPAAGGGGASVFFLKPSWQTGAGVPNNGARNVPDIALAASPNHNGYLVYNGGKLSVFGGTSAGTPVFAGMIALLNQSQARSGGGSGVGNINPRLYSLAQSAPSVFHDVTAGNNVVTITCGARSRNCTSGSYGYNAGSNYDQASGLGSVNAYNLVSGWSGNLSSVTPGTTSITLAASTSTIAPGGSVTLTATVSATNGGTPLGTVTFSLGGASIGSATLAATASGSTAALTLAGTTFAIGANSITAQYSGDASYSASTTSTTITVTAPSTDAPTITGLTNAASFRTAYAPGMLMSIFGSALAPATWSASTVPLPSQVGGLQVTVNGSPAPLLYVSPAQLNVQVPYEVAAGSTATLVVNNNGKTATTTFAVSNAAPGVFVNSTFAPVPSTSAARGQTATLFITGAGAVAPLVSTGAAPAAGTAVQNLPAPQQNLTVTVGGLPASVSFAGIPAGLVGVVQVNYQVPAQAVVGSNAVVVQVGTIAGPPANLVVTQ